MDVCTTEHVPVLFVRLQKYMFNVQWNPSNPDTSGPESTVLIIEVSSLQGLEMYYGLS